MKQKLLYLLAMILSTFAVAQVKLSVVSDARDTKENGTLKLTIILEISGANLIQETPLRLPDLSNFVIIADGSEQNTFVDAKRNIAVNQQIFQYLLTPKQSGKLRIGSVLVTVNGKIYKSEPFDIIVDEPKLAAAPEKRESNIYLNLELQKAEVYKNQPTIAVLKVYSKDLNNFRKVHNIKLPQQSDLTIKAVSYKKSEIEQNAKKDLASQVIAVFMIYPKKSGKIEILPVSASLKQSDQSSKIASNKPKLNVKKLPSVSSKNFKDAVGNFDFQLTSLDPLKKVEVDQPLNIALKISGSGNLNEIELPKLKNSPNYTFYKPNISYKTVSTGEGDVGEVTLNYVVIPRIVGTLNIATEAFTFFNPATGKYVDLGAKSMVIPVLSHEDFADTKSTMEKVNEYTNNVLETVNTPVVKTDKFKIKTEQPFQWKTILMNYGIMGLILLLLIFGYNRYKNTKSTKHISSSPEITTVSETEADLKEQSGVDIDSYLSYLQKLLSNHDYHKFFMTFEDLKNETENKIYSKYNLSLKAYFETHLGSGLAEEYRSLLQEVEMEKYIPQPSPEHLGAINDRIRKIFSNIAK